MATYSTNQFRPGLKVLLDGSPCSIIENEFVKPGKGRAFTKVKLRNLKTNRVLDRTLKSNETLESAEVVTLSMEYMYSDGECWHFMKTDGSYEQYAIPKNTMEDAKLWISPQDICEVTLWENIPIGVTPPNFVTLEIEQTKQSIKKASNSGTKPATMSTGAVVKVPLFLSDGDTIRIDTRTGEYQSRKKAD